MPSFRYQAIDSNGAASAGTLDAPDRSGVVRALEQRGLVAVAIDSDERAAGSARVRETRPTISRAETANLVRELATALEAGLPLLQALRTTRRQAGNRKLEAILDFLIERVEAGQPLAKAAQEYGPPFDDLVVGMFRAADATGRTSEILHQLADLLDRAVELRREVTAATVYPLIVAGLIAASTVVLVTFLLPRLMAPIAGQTGMTLPWPTMVLLGVADFLKAWWWAIGGAIVGLVFLWRWWIRDPGNRLLVDTVLLRIPVLGRLLRDVAVARFTRTLGTLASAGVPILTALRIVRDTLGNTALMKAIDEVGDKVTTGQSLADPLERSGHFPPLLIQIVNIGERSGRLESMLLHAATAFDRQVNSSLRIFTKALPPLLLVVMASVAAFVLAAIILPLLQMQEAIGA
ncbi:MAG: type II secretion system F family protein [Phycisphaerales bacterium]